MSRNLLQSTMIGFGRRLTRTMLSEKIAREHGLLQSLDPRVRVVGLLALVLAVTLSRKISVVAALLAIAIVLALSSKVSPVTLAKRVWLIALGFTGVIALPALFVTPGRAIASLGSLSITEQGLRTATLLVLRVETAVTLTTLLMLCTPWAQVLKALRVLHLPKEAVTMLAMSYRYIFLLVETAGQMFESRISRTVGGLPRAEQRRVTTRTAGVLLSKSVALGNDVYLAMESRGFRGDIQVLSDFRMRSLDYVVLLLFLVAAAAAVWMGR
jgi:cobalt/nickel transport system permease protein